MTRLAVLAAAVVLGGCAIGRVYPDGRVEGFAVGHAELRWSGVVSSPAVPLDAAGYPSAAFCAEAAPEMLVSSHIQGGDLSTNFASSLSIVGSAAVAIFTGGVVW